MDVQKYIEKMVLVPFERWNQLLDIEQKLIEKTEESDKEKETTTEESQDSASNYSQSVEENIAKQDIEHPPPPGIPMNGNEIEYEKKQSQKQRKRKSEHVTTKDPIAKQRKKQTLLTKWLTLP